MTKLIQYLFSRDVWLYTCDEVNYCKVHFVVSSRGAGETSWTSSVTARWQRSETSRHFIWTPLIDVCSRRMRHHFVWSVPFLRCVCVCVWFIRVERSFDCQYNRLPKRSNVWRSGVFWVACVVAWPTHAEFRAMCPKRHSLHTVEIDKVCLSAYDDKKCILADGIRTLAYGHYKLI